jgi:endonuclease/exonuclease/phosphatase family metal-dependent hydrolase
MDKPLRVATWNLDHASNSNRPIDLQVTQILAIRPDILVLTETCDEIDLASHGYTLCLPLKKSPYGKYWTAIHLSERVSLLEEMAAFRNDVISCARVRTYLGELVVYGTIIPYRDFKVREGTSAPWQEHYRAIEAQADEWAKLTRDAALVVAGDFNQTRDRSKRTYGTNAGREALTRALEKCRLECLTEEDFGKKRKLKPDPEKGWARNNIDHICVTRDTYRVADVGAWDHFITTGDGTRYLSDHNGVYVDLIAR